MKHTQAKCFGHLPVYHKRASFQKSVQTNLLVVLRLSCRLFQGSQVAPLNNCVVRQHIVPGYRVLRALVPGNGTVLISSQLPHFSKYTIYLRQTSSLLQLQSRYSLGHMSPCNHNGEFTPKYTTLKKCHDPPSYQPTKAFLLPHSAIGPLWSRKPIPGGVYKWRPSKRRKMEALTRVM